MGILERQMMTRQTIAANLFCGHCGYNLRTRPVISRCPECGRDYDARPSTMKGILRDEGLMFPFGMWGLFLLSLALCGGFIAVGVMSRSNWNYAPAVVFVILAAANGILAIRRTARYWRHRRLLRDAGQADV